MCPRRIKLRLWWMPSVQSSSSQPLATTGEIHAVASVESIVFFYQPVSTYPITSYYYIALDESYSQRKIPESTANWSRVQSEYEHGKNMCVDYSFCSIIALPHMNGFLFLPTSFRKIPRIRIVPGGLSLVLSFSLNNFETMRSSLQKLSICRQKIP